MLGVFGLSLHEFQCCLTADMGDDLKYYAFSNLCEVHDRSSFLQHVASKLKNYRQKCPLFDRSVFLPTEVTFCFFLAKTEVSFLVILGKRSVFFPYMFV